MTTTPIAFLISLALATVATPIIRNLAIRYRWIDEGRTTRNVHKAPIPRLGGLAIVLGFYAPLTALLLVESDMGRMFTENTHNVVGLFVGGLLIVALGVYDDIRGANAFKKLLIQIGVAVLMCYLGFRIERINLLPGYVLELHMFSVPFTVLWIVGVTNALNLIDGLDGLASGVALFAVLTNLIISISTGNLLMVLFMACLAGAILGFLIYNFNPASVFMGDTGSMFLGFILATTSIAVNAKGHAVIAILTPVLALGLPIMDVLLAMVRRGLRGVPLFSADKEHIHHKLLAHGLSQRQCVFLLYGISACFMASAIGVSYANSSQAVFLILAVVLLVAVLVRKLGYGKLLHNDTQQVRRRNRKMLAAVKSIAQEVRDTPDATNFQRLTDSIGTMFDADIVELTVPQPSGDDEVFIWKQKPEPGTGVSLRLPLTRAPLHFGQLNVSWCDGRTNVDRDDEIAAERLVAQIAHSVGRFWESEKQGTDSTTTLR